MATNLFRGGTLCLRPFLFSTLLLAIAAPALAQLEPAVPSPAPAAPPELSLWPRAVEQVLASARSSDPFLRANAIEAAQSLPDRILPLAQLGLSDAHPAVRFAALASIGKLKLTDLGPACQRLLQDPDPSVRAAAMFALRQTGQKVDVSPMSALLVSPDPRVRGNAALLTGWMGDKSAVPMLQSLARRPLPATVSALQTIIVRIQIAEALTRLGDEAALDVIRAGAFSQSDEVRVLAVTMLGRLSDRRMERACLDMLRQRPIELQLAAAGTLARLNWQEGLPITVEGAGSTLPTVRAQAAMTLAMFREAQIAPALARLLEDPSEQVRLSAAAAILTRQDLRSPEPAKLQTADGK